MKTTVSERGQITIPKRIREKLGIRAGETLDFEAENGRLVATKASDRDPVDEVYGTLEIEGSIDELISEMRDESSD